MPIKATGIIPARYASTRFPGKLLQKINNKTIIQHVWERTSAAKSLSSVIVATDDNRIKAEVNSFGGEVVMTSSDHVSGTDRIAEVAASIDSDIIVNIQGDEPMIDPKTIDKAVAPLLEDPTIVMSTICTPIEKLEELKSPNIVKVIFDLNGFALYFSRFPIPFNRDNMDDQSSLTGYYKHIGLYVFRKEFLIKFSKLPVSFLEHSEKLEQLRILENGYKIKVLKTQYNSFGIDTPEDLEHIKSFFV